MGKSTISMAILKGYLSWPEGNNTSAWDHSRSHRGSPNQGPADMHRYALKKDSENSRYFMRKIEVWVFEYICGFLPHVRSQVPLLAYYRFLPEMVLGASSHGSWVVHNHGWLVVWNMNFIFPFSWECHHPNWRSPIFQRGGLKPATRWYPFPGYPIEWVN